MQPIGNSTQSVVVKRGHLTRIHRAIGTEAIPAFPDGGGPHRYWVEPRRTVTLHQQSIGDVRRSNTAQSIAEKWRPHEAGADTISPFTDKCDQTFTCMPSLFSITEQSELESQCIGCLRVAQHAPSRSHILGVKGIPNLGGKRKIACLIIGPTKNARHPPKQFC